MKIGILTFHFVHNNGAMLQCWALQNQLTKMGHDVMVIDYRPLYHAKKYSAWKRPFLEDKDKDTLSKLRILASNYRYFTRKKRAKEFNKFEDNFNLTFKISDISECKKLDIYNFDLIICGSDQIWNPKLTDGKFDPVYFAKIPGFKGKKIAYAISSGESDLNQKCEEIKEMTADFAAVSARENNTSNQLKNIVNPIPVLTVPDPTLLLDADQYKKITSKIKHSNYILVYKLEDSPILNKTVEKLAHESGLRVINISPTELLSSVENEWIKNVGPNAFLGFISGAEAIVTNSFHGTVFSIIFQKKVFVVPHSTRNERLSNLLTELKATDLFVYDEKDICSVQDKHVDYLQIESNIKRMRKNGIEFLESFIK